MIMRWLWMQGSAPAPKDEEVTIVDAPGVTVYVKVGDMHVMPSQLQLVIMPVAASFCLQPM